MLSSLKRKLTKEPEYSVPLRLLVLAAMLVPLLALGRVHSGLWPHVIIAAIGISLGHWHSYRNLKQQSQLVRAIMFVALHLAICWLFLGLASGATVPQAQFAIFAQAITSFDLRHRSSLFNTLVHSLAILYVAASLSRTVELGIYLLLFLGLVLAAFFMAEAETGLKAARLRPQAPTRLALPPRSLTLFSLSFGAIALIAIFIIFLFTPRFANRPIVPPFSLNFPLSGGVKSEIINPGVPLVQVNGWSDGVSDYYYGFDTELDLRYRGGLSDEIVMYVRSPSRSYWRSHSYDFYDGLRWGQSDKSLTNIENRGVYFQLPAPLGSPQSQEKVGQLQADGDRSWNSPSPRRHVEEALGVETPILHSWQTDEQVVQTFNIIREQPNLIFAAYRPLEIFISAQTLSLDAGDGMRLPEALQAGMTYSVVSYRPNFAPEILRTLPASYPPEISERYLQLPDNISGRVKDLALSLTRPYTNSFDKVEALNTHLRTTYPYNYFPPPHPPGAEVVDNFLFEDREGVCEQYVTALVVMARSLGIPARLASGYGAGDYNAITGYYEVRFSHAHSWAEVYFPDYGWVPFDPTPGWSPQPYPTPIQNWLFSNNGQLLNQLSGLNLPLGAIASGGLAGLAYLAPILIGVGVLLGLVILVLLFSRRLRAALARWAAGRYSQIADETQTRRRILKLYSQALHLLGRYRYRQRRPSETIAEYAEATGNFPSLTHLSHLAEVAAYRPQPPGVDEVQEAAQAMASFKAEIKREV